MVRSPLHPDDVVRWEGMPVTGVLRTLVDGAEVGLAADVGVGAIRETLRRKLDTPEALERRAAGERSRLWTLVEGVLAEGEAGE